MYVIISYLEVTIDQAVKGRVNEVFAFLPEVVVDPNKHFVKKVKYTSEIRIFSCAREDPILECPNLPTSSSNSRSRQAARWCLRNSSPATCSPPCIPSQRTRSGFFSSSMGYAAFLPSVLFTVISASITSSSLSAILACSSVVLRVSGGTDWLLRSPADLYWRLAGLRSQIPTIWAMLLGI